MKDILEMTLEEIEQRGGAKPLEPYYLLHEKCGMISTFYTMYTGTMPACLHCGQGNDYTIVKVIEKNGR